MPQRLPRSSRYTPYTGERAALVGLALSLVLGAGLLFAADTPRLDVDPRIAISGFKPSGYTAEFTFTNKGVAPIVVWTVNGLYMELPGSGRVAYESVGCGDGYASRDLLPPGGVRHVVVRPGSCTMEPLRRITAIFADGTLAGTWSDVEELVKWLTVERLVAQRWLDKLRAIQRDGDAVARVGELVAGLYLREIPDLSWECRGGCFVRFREQPPKEVVEQRASFYFSAYAGRLYHRLLRPGGSPWIYRRAARDEGAEKQLMSRPDAGEHIRNTLAKETELVQRDIDDLAWVTVFGPNGERVGPAVPPPPPRPREEAEPTLKNRSSP